MRVERFFIMLDEMFCRSYWSKLEKSFKERREWLQGIAKELTQFINGFVKETDPKNFFVIVVADNRIRIGFAHPESGNKKYMNIWVELETREPSSIKEETRRLYVKNDEDEVPRFRFDGIQNEIFVKELTQFIFDCVKR